MSTPRHKRLRLRWALALVIVLAGMPGCVTRSARTSPEVGTSHRMPYVQRPHLYPGTRYVVLGGAFHHGICKAFGESVEEWERGKPTSAFGIDGDRLGRYLFVYMPIGVALAVGTVIVELPVALITDTALLPYDVYRIRTDLPSEAIFAEALFGDTWPVPLKTFREHYRPASGDPWIRQLLEAPQTPHFDEKVTLLIDAGAGLNLMAHAATLDAGLANVLIHRALTLPDPDEVLRGLADNTNAPIEALVLLAQIAADERWLPLTPILAANPAASGDVLDRLVPAVPLTRPAFRDQFQSLTTAAKHPAIRPETLDRLAQLENEPVLRQVAQHPSTPPDTLRRLADSPFPAVVDQVARNPSTPPDLLRQWALAPTFMAALMENPALPVEVIEILVNRATAEPSDVPSYLLGHLAGHANATEAQLFRLIDYCHDHPQFMLRADNPLWGARYNLVWRRHTSIDALRQMADLESGMERLLGSLDPIDGMVDRDSRDKGSHILTEIAAHPQADAQLLIGIVRACRAHPDAGRYFLGHAQRHAEIRLAESVETPAVMMAELATQTQIRDTLRLLSENPAASPAALQAVIARCQAWIDEISSGDSTHSQMAVRLDTQTLNRIKDRAAARLVPK